MQLRFLLPESVVLTNLASQRFALYGYRLGIFVAEQPHRLFLRNSAPLKISD